MSTMRELTAGELRATLARRRVSAAELARRLDWKQSYMARRIDGRVALDVDDLEAIARVLEVSLVDLLPREVRTNERSASMDVRGMPASAPASTSADRGKRCAPDVRPSAVSGMRRRPRVRATVTEPIPA